MSKPQGISVSREVDGDIVRETVSSDPTTGMYTNLRERYVYAMVFDDTGHNAIAYPCDIVQRYFIV